MATLDTYATEGALPTGANGDMAYVTATDRIYVNDAGTWRYWNYDAVAGVDANDLAYTGAKTGNPTSGTNYVVTVQPAVHYDASKYVTTDGSATALGAAVDAWGDRSGNDNDGTQGTSADQPTLVQTAGGYRGLQWPSSTTLGSIGTNYTPSSGQPGHTIVIAVLEPDAMSWTGIVNNWGAYPAGGAVWNAGMSAFDAGRCTNICVGRETLQNTTTATSPVNYLRVLSILDVDDDQRIFFNLAGRGSFTASYTDQAAIDARLDGEYVIGSNGFKTFGATAANNHGGIFYEVLIFQSALSYTLTGSDLTGGNLKIVTDYLMNKYQIGTDYIS